MGFNPGYVRQAAQSHLAHRKPSEVKAVDRAQWEKYKRNRKAKLEAEAFADFAPMEFTIDYPVSANRYWRNFNGRMVVSAEARAYKVKAAAEAKRQGARPVVGPVAVIIDFYRPARRGDLDNLNKVVLDALKGVAFVDDSQVVELHTRRHDDKDSPRAVVTVSRAIEQRKAA